MARYPMAVAGLDPEQLAEEVSRLRYDALAKFLDELGARLERDGMADEFRGRRMLAERLSRAGRDAISAGRSVRNAWKICESRMRNRRCL